MNIAPLVAAIFQGSQKKKLSQEQFQNPSVPATTTSPSDEPRVCGLTKIWALPPDHPFTKEACSLHDRWYEMKEKKMETPGRKAVDRAFWEAMRRVAKKKKSPLLKAESYLFYGLVRLFGKVAWDT